MFYISFFSPHEKILLNKNMYNHNIKKEKKNPHTSSQDLEVKSQSISKRRVKMKAFPPCKFSNGRQHLSKSSISRLYVSLKIKINSHNLETPERPVLLFHSQTKHIRHFQGLAANQERNGICRRSRSSRSNGGRPTQQRD